ncbi:replication protein rep [Enterococcus plantarum]|uniref:Replication protein rep n=2 Tax=Enterococcus TaxID=1350 RepID=A0A2W3ZB70_9ENTE|nr:replication protein rep [Enterococcus plantarum]
MNEVTKYHNDLNTVVMRRWTKEEMNFFFAIIAKARENQTKILKFESIELKELTHFSGDYNQRWNDIMDRVTDKVAQLIYKERTSKKKVVMTLFKKFEVDFESQNVTISISDEFEYILNQLNANFTSFELEEFTKIRSTYAKTTYRILKQWRTQGIKEFRKEEFHELLDIPKSYAQSDINKRVLKPIQEELTNYFKGLKVNLKKAKTRGNPITGYCFTWQAEKTGEWKDFEELRMKKTPIRTETIPEQILAVEKEDQERKKKLQEEFFQKAMQLRDRSFDEQAQLFSEAREVDTYRMPNATQFLDTLATLMSFDLKKYWDPILQKAQSEGEENG